MLVFRLMGTALIVFVCSAAGFFKGLSIKTRYKKLLLFCSGIEMLYEYIEQGGYELNKAIKNAFLKCSFICLKDGSFFCVDNDLNNEDKTLINDFLSSLGCSTKKTECDRIKTFAINIKKRLKEAENEAAQKSKIYQTFGVCIGLILGVLFV